MEKNEIKKDLYKSKVSATFAYYDGDTGKLYYNIQLFGDPYIFPMSVIDEEWVPDSEGDTMKEYSLANDLKGAKFGAEIKGSELNRWIVKALDNNDLVKLS